MCSKDAVGKASRQYWPWSDCSFSYTDQTAPSEAEAVRSGSALFAQTGLSKYLMVVVIIADKIARVDIKTDKVSGAWNIGNGH